MNEMANGNGGRVEQIVERCLDLHSDIGLDAVKHWKESRPDARAIGYLPVYIPEEVIHAVGALPVGIVGGGDRGQSVV